MPMSYLSGSILLSVRLRMDPDRVDARAATASFSRVQPAQRFAPCNGKGLPIMSSRNVAARTKLG
jgi:hypothetical protein